MIKIVHLISVHLVVSQVLARGWTLDFSILARVQLEDMGCASPEP